MLSQLQQVVSQINSPNGTIGKLINSDELYNKANAAIDNLNKIIDEVNNGQGNDRQVPQRPHSLRQRQQGDQLRPTS